MKQSQQQSGRRSQNNYASATWTRVDLAGFVWSFGDFVSKRISEVRQDAGDYSNGTFYQLPKTESLES